MILDLMRHTFTKAHELYGDRWLGFEPGELQKWLEESGFNQIEIDTVAREEEPPHFQTILASATKTVPATEAGATQPIVHSGRRNSTS
jgi:ArsR family transcriptional regulator